MELCTSYGVGKRSYSSDVIRRMALVTHGEQSVNYVFLTVKEKDFVQKERKMNIFIDVVKSFGYNKSYLRKGRDCKSDLFLYISISKFGI